MRGNEVSLTPEEIEANEHFHQSPSTIQPFVNTNEDIQGEGIFHKVYNIAKKVVNHPITKSIIKTGSDIAKDVVVKAGKEALSKAISGGDLDCNAPYPHVVPMNLYNNGMAQYHLNQMTSEAIKLWLVDQD